jgi:hypothetical protein
MINVNMIMGAISSRKTPEHLRIALAKKYVRLIKK